MPRPVTILCSNSDLGASDSVGTFLPAEGSAARYTFARRTAAIDIEDAESVPGAACWLTCAFATPARRWSAPRTVSTTPHRFTSPRVPTASPIASSIAAIDKAASGFRFLPQWMQRRRLHRHARGGALVRRTSRRFPNGALLYSCRVTVDAAPPTQAPSRCTIPRRPAPTPMPSSCRRPDATRTITVLADNAAVAIDVGTVHAVSGQRAIVPVSLRLLDSEAAAVAGTQNEIVFDPTAPIAAAGGWYARLRGQSGHSQERHRLPLPPPRLHARSRLRAGARLRPRPGRHRADSGRIRALPVRGTGRQRTRRSACIRCATKTPSPAIPAAIPSRPAAAADRWR